MSFEQLDNEYHASEKKKKKLEQEKAEAFYNEKRILRESSSMLRKLAKEISQEFGIDESEVQKLLQQKEDLTAETLKSSFSQIKESQGEKFLEAISGGKKHIENYSKKEREKLKKTISHDSFSPESHNYKITQLIVGESLRSKAENPQNISDQILGAGLGIIDSSEAIIFFLYELGKGILLTPYHLYLMLQERQR